MVATPAPERPAAERLDDLYSALNCSPLGLSSEEAGRRLRLYGPNLPAEEKRRSFLLQFLALFTNPILIILLSASAVAAFLGEHLEASIIVVIVVLSSAIDFIQSYRAHVGIERLKAQVAIQATVLRDGQWVELPRKDVVPGDVVRIMAGDLAPADCALIASRDLHVQEAALTGESLPAEKESPLPDTPLEPRHRVWMGTSVVSGNATALAVSTGMATEFGRIAGKLSQIPQETDFEHGLRQFGGLILKTILLLVLSVFLITAIVHQATLEALLFAVALAVGLTPEFLPMITAITLSQGAMQMAKNRVIVKRLAAIQNFGAIDIFCSDKTGTLTSGEMSLEKYVDAAGEQDEEVFVLAYLNSRYQTGVKNPMDAAVHSAGGRTPLEDAIMRHHGPTVSESKKLDELPFDFERRRVSVVLERNGEPWLIAKGSPETVLHACTLLRRAGQPLAMTEDLREECLSASQNMGNQGLRVLAVAARRAPVKPAYSIADEEGLTFYGFLGFSDPPLPDAAAAIRSLGEDGITVKILTGDTEAVARHVCRQVGLEAPTIVTGNDLIPLDLPKTRKIVEEANIFARVTPSQKTMIIEALRKNGHAVGFMGDGINDAPSLRAADVGISVANAVDVARDAADIILLEPGLQVLHKAIREGRRAFVNVVKYLFMGTSSNFGNMVSMAAASLFLPFLPMTATQILVNNFLYDTSQLSIPTDTVDESMLKKPRRWNISVLRRFMLGIGPISSVFDFVTFFVLLRFFHASAPQFQTGWFVESLATQTLVLFVIRTAGNPLRSRPSGPLAATILGIVIFGLALPFLGLGRYFGFVPLPASFFVFLTAVTIVYLGAVQYAKRLAMRGYLT